MDILFLEGDGIGPEITAAAPRVLDAVSQAFALDLKFERLTIGLGALKEYGTTFPPQTLKAAREADGIILGPVSHDDYPSVSGGGINPSGALRKVWIFTPISVRPAPA